MMESLQAESLDRQIFSRGLQESVEVSELRKGEENHWDRFVTDSPHGTFFHLSGWQKVVTEALRRKCFALVARRNGRISGVLPISQTKNLVFGNALVSMPLAVYGGICADDRESYFQLLGAANRLANDLGAKYVEFRNRTEAFPTDLPGRDLYVTFTQDLTPGPEKLLQRLPRDTRYAIRKSQRAGLAWTEDLTIDEFYELYARNVHRLGTPVFPKALFPKFLKVFPAQSRLFGVRKGKQAIAGVMCFYFRDVVLPYYSGSLAEFYRDSPNNFMYWNLIAQSCREGYRLFDFGRSKKGSGSCEFKSSWAMKVEDLPYRYALSKAAEVPQLSPVDKGFQTAVSLWKKMPYACTKVLGPALIRSIPSI